MGPSSDMAEGSERSERSSGESVEAFGNPRILRPYWRLEILNEISGQLLEEADPDTEVIPGLFETVSGGTGIDCVFAYRLSRLGTELELTFAGGTEGKSCSHHPRRVPFGQGIGGIVAATCEAVHVAGIATSSHPHAQMLREAGFTAYACEPVVHSGRLFGILCFASKTVTRFTAADLLLFQGVARHVALAHERAERVHEMRECNRELQHRVNNVLSTVHAIAVLSGRSSSDPAEFAADFGERLAALGKTQNLLTRHGQTARLRDLLCADLAPFDQPGRLHLRGPAVRLPASIAVFLGIAIHELTTNSVRYGALSSEHGTLRVYWRVRSDGFRNRLLIDWEEADGPRVTPPAHRGFGARLLDGGLGRQIKLRRHFDPAGLRVAVEVVLD